MNTAINTSLQREKLDSLLIECKNALVEMREAEKVYKKKYETWMKLKIEAESIDRELAMIDGRYKKVSSKKEKRDVPMELSKQDVIELARKLGVEISLV